MDLSLYIMSGVLGMVFFILSFFVRDKNEKLIIAGFSCIFSFVLAWVSLTVTFWHELTEITLTSVELAFLWVLVALVQVIRLFMIPYSDAMEAVERGR